MASPEESRLPQLQKLVFWRQVNDLNVMAANTPFSLCTLTKHETDSFWVQKWSNNDTPWRALEREVGAPVFPQPMFQASRQSP